MSRYRTDPERLARASRNGARATHARAERGPRVDSYHRVVDVRGQVLEEQRGRMKRCKW